jgi:hypothetical protein
MAVPGGIIRWSLAQHRGHGSDNLRLVRLQGLAAKRRVPAEQGIHGLHAFGRERLDDGEAAEWHVSQRVAALLADEEAPPRGASDAWLTPFHVDRSKIFVHERAEVFGPAVDPARVAAAIELTRFPASTASDSQANASEGGLVRAADLIGQLADPNYLRKQNALFHDFVETGIAEKLKLTSPADLSEGYVAFFWQQVEPYIGEALRYLALTQEGRQWTANLYAQVFAVEHHRWQMGPHRGTSTRPARPA